MNIIIAGCGKVGSALAQQLNDEGHNITMIDINPSDYIASPVSIGHSGSGR